VRLLRSVAITLLTAGILVPAAHADGLPVLGVDVGTDGVEAGGIRYVTLPAPHRTLVEQIALPDGRVVRFRYLPGRFTIPAVAYDGSADGLSADGKTLVLIQPRARFPRRTTRLAVLGTQRLQLRETVRLPGDYSFDAISPDGRTIYLIHYLSADDPTVYEVRAYDLARGRLLPNPIVDPYESGEEMRGNPVTRKSSRDRRWAYTLYDGGGAEPFVHALDTVGRTARCIDLDLLAGRRDLNRLRLRLVGAVLAVTAADEAVARIDTRTFAVSTPEPASTPVARAESRPPWLLLGGAIAATLLAALAAARIVRRLRQPDRLRLGAR
jgi:hypothetical protein